MRVAKARVEEQIGMLMPRQVLIKRQTFGKNQPVGIDSACPGRLDQMGCRQIIIFEEP